MLKMLSDYNKDYFSSFVVFLIALPLCLGISIASGVDPVKGLLTGIIGGVFVSLFTGSSLQVSGPSAGLAVMVLHVVSVYGPHSLIPLGIIVGLFQLGTAYFRLAHFFQATPPALLKAMLSGIGALILLSQFYIILDLPMSSEGLKNLAGIPSILNQMLQGHVSTAQLHSTLIATVVVFILFLWSFGKSNFFDLVPGPLVATLSAGLLVYFAGWDMRMVQLPKDIVGEIMNLHYAEGFSVIDLNFLAYAVGFAFVASVETLLCVGAIDKLAKTTSSYNQTIMAQGAGNILAGFLGAIPVVGVISRSAANLEFGAQSRLSSVLHGAWLAIFLFLPGVLGFIPIPALAGLLIYVGAKLLDPPHIFDYFRSRNKTALIFFTTLILTISVDLLAGVLAGFAVSILILVADVLKYDLDVVEEGDNKVLKFKGKLSFLDLPVLSKTLQGEDLEDATNLEICLREVDYLDPAISEHLSELKDKLEAKGKSLKIRYSKFNIH